MRISRLKHDLRPDLVWCNNTVSVTPSLRLHHLTYARPASSGIGGSRRLKLRYAVRFLRVAMDSKLAPNCSCCPATSRPTQDDDKCNLLHHFAPFPTKTPIFRAKPSRNNHLTHAPMCAQCAFNGASLQSVARTKKESGSIQGDIPGSIQGDIPHWAGKQAAVPLSLPFRLRATDNARLPCSLRRRSGGACASIRRRSLRRCVARLG